MGRKLDIKSADGDQTTIGAKADSAATNHTSDWSVVSLLKWIGQSLASLVGNSPALSGGKVPVIADAGSGNFNTKPDGTSWSLTGTSANVNLTNVSIAATQSGTWDVRNISGTVSLPTGAATSANQTTANTSLSSIDGKLPTALVSGSLATTVRDASGNPVDFTGTVPVINTSAYPSGATAIIATASGANSTVTASLAGASGKVTYLVGYMIESQGATGASVVTPTVTGLTGGTTITRILQVVAGATTKNEVLTQTFNPGIPASAANTAIDVVCPALGSGNTRALVTAWGYQL